MTTTSGWHFEVRRDDLRQSRIERIEPGDDLPLAPGQVLLEIDKLALTSNNITYAALGEQLGYWRFFPAAPGWGRVPAWGHAAVVRSAHDEVAVGERVFGYVPMSTHLVITPGQLRPDSLVDLAPHRQSLPPTYNRYVRSAPQAPRSAEEEDALAIWRPLFGTAFLLDDLLEDRGLLEADAVVLTSASSKTALGLAFLLHRRPRRPRVIGLTSATRTAFVAATGLYDEVLTYARLDELAAPATSVLVDFAGDGALLARSHAVLGAGLRLSLRVGATHLTGSGAARTPPGPTPEVFFAPDRIVARIGAWGAETFQARQREAWSAFAPSMQSWLTVVHRRGPEALTATFRQLVDGQTDPAQAIIITPRE